MPRPIGDIIRKLRKERKLTQEELAEQLNISSQAVSKWENSVSMPDISMIVPLSTVLGVSTDVLFDVGRQSDDEVVRRVIEEARGDIYDEHHTVTADGLWRAYLRESATLETYPNNIALLSDHLELGIALAYPENPCYDAEHAPDIYRECVREANLVVTYGRETTAVLRAHMIMVLLHAANGDFERATAHAAHFPHRADMTAHKMQAYMEHFRRDPAAEAVHCQNGIMMHLEALLDTVLQSGIAHMNAGRLTDALASFLAVFAINDAIFGDEPLPTALHDRERDDAHLLIAEVYTRLAQYTEALSWLEKLLDYELSVRPRYTPELRVRSPLMKDAHFTPFRRYRTAKGYLEGLATACRAARFAPLMQTARGQALLSRIDAEIARM